MRPIIIAVFVLALSSTTGYSQTQQLSQRKAANDFYSREKANGHSPTLEDVEKAVDDVRQQEVKAFNAGHPEFITPADLEDVKKAVAEQVQKAKDDEDRLKSIAVAKASDDAQIKKQDADVARGLKENHCPSHVSIGTAESCVYLLKGWPDHINADALSGKQLVYPHAYIYINLRGRVEDIQTQE
jgi:hypothetical protein